MKNDMVLLEYAFGIVLLISTIVGYVYTDLYVSISISFLFIFFGIPAIYDGYVRSKNDTKTGLAKSRSVAMILSFVPGFGHYYLGHKKESALFILIMGASLYLLLIFFLRIFDYYDYCLLLGLIILSFDVILSSIEVNKMCDLINLPYDGTDFEMKLKNTDGAELVLTLIALACILISTYFYVTDIMPIGMEVMPIYVCTAFCSLLLSAFAVLKLKNIINLHTRTRKRCNN